MAVLNLLAEPETYVPCSTENMHVDHEYRDYWLRHFETHFSTVMRLALEQYGPSAAGRVEACKQDFITTLQQIRANPTAVTRLDLLVLDQLRQDILIQHELPDPFEKTKARENDVSL